MLQHARDHSHHFRKEDVTVLTSKHDWVKRGIKEALYIIALKPSINIDPGRHNLSSHFDSILESTIVAPPPPRPHNADNEVLINTMPRRQGRPRREPNQHATPATTNSESAQQQQQQQTRQSQRFRDRQEHLTLAKTIAVGAP